MEKVYIGIDNGPSGSIGLVGNSTASMLFPAPIKLLQDYTKKKKNVNRLNPEKFIEIINTYSNPKMVLIERPFVNPMMFNATLSAIRFLEATLIMLESLDIPYMFLDSKEWQKVLLPEGCKGKEELKKASHDIGIRLFPICESVIQKQKDADGLLIAEYGRRKGL